MTDLDVFKRHVGYRVQAAQETFTGTPLTLTLDLRYENVSNVELFLDNTAYPSNSYTLDDQRGVITFAGTPGDGTIISVRYRYASFTDSEAQALIDEYGLDLAVIEALREILANQARLRNYKHADTEVDNSQVFKQVSALLKMYEDHYQKNESSETGGIVTGRRNDPRGERDCGERDVSRLYG